MSGHNHLGALADVEAEIEFLSKELYQREISPLIRRITAYDRFSDHI